MTERNRKLYWLFKIVGVIISCGLPIWAVCEKFPIWQEKHGTGYSIGIGVILIIVILAMVFRSTVFSFIKEHLNLKHAPPLTIWLVLLAISYTFVYIGQVARDMTTIFWMGFAGCIIGNVFTYLSERLAKEVNTNGA
jgi:hypothetical protein